MELIKFNSRFALKKLCSCKNDDHCIFFYCSLNANSLICIKNNAGQRSKTIMLIITLSWYMYFIPSLCLKFQRESHSALCCPKWSQKCEDSYCKSIPASNKIPFKRGSHQIPLSNTLAERTAPGSCFTCLLWESVPLHVHLEQVLPSIALITFTWVKTQTWVKPLIVY